MKISTVLNEVKHIAILAAIMSLIPFIIGIVKDNDSLAEIGGTVLLVAALLCGLINFIQFISNKCLHK
ncbi:hypothetical protein S14_225 [Shewanella sp. phage 1/4]|uniref:hypothetical protein n=1 Tax=Shewanella phage 1/4 TaxID=1458859 RepID=UPI0004F74CAE|nr:hypothetical protein S14_225 [Shewanella sp. phage 1/4]AHK11334.1 hypothetical protein S14_225 [Shewanella sp. phage 1/4]